MLARPPPAGAGRTRRGGTASLRKPAPAAAVPLGAVAAGLYVNSLMSSMPHPFDDVTAIEYSQASLDVLPGNRNGSTVPPAFSGPLAANKRLQAS